MTVDELVEMVLANGGLESEKEIIKKTIKILIELEDDKTGLNDSPASFIMGAAALSKPKAKR